MATWRREDWRLTMDWLATGERLATGELSPDDADAQARAAEAAARDCDVAQVDAWAAAAAPLPAWARQVDTMTPHWGVEICNEAWLPYLEMQLGRIAQGAWVASQLGWCGGASLARRQWAAWAIDALTDWVDGASADPQHPAAEIAALLGPRDADKAGAVRLLAASLGLAVAQPPAQFEARFAEAAATTPLAEEMRGRIKYLRFGCGYRWEHIVRETCRAIGDRAYREGTPRYWQVGACNGQIAFATRDAPRHIPATSGVLVGLWAWLRDVPAETVATTYPEAALVAEQVRRQLGEATPVKRWLAGRLFIGVRIWLEAYDHGKLAPPRPALAAYPRLTKEDDRA